jgi:ribose 5-phosphate isomerase A
MFSSPNDLKRMSAEKAVERIKSGMVVGLGTGSTTDFALQSIANKLQTGEISSVQGVPSSIQTERRSKELGIPLTNLENHPALDLTIDGADEIDPELRLIKGGGAALLREKIVAQASRYLLIVADESKLSPRLGTKSAIPVEILPFGFGAIARRVEALGATVKLRMDEAGSPIETDQGNWIIDCDFGPINDPDELGTELKRRAGIIEHGLFIGLASEVFLASAEGVRLLKSSN